MWYLLLALVTTSADSTVSVYSAAGVHATQADCEGALVTDYRGEGMCVPVELKMIELPKDNVITVEELPEMGS